jgi:hypothetical protein
MSSFVNNNMRQSVWWMTNHSGPGRQCASGGDRRFVADSPLEEMDSNFRSRAKERSIFEPPRFDRDRPG